MGKTRVPAIIIGGKRMMRKLGEAWYGCWTLGRKNILGEAVPVLGTSIDIRAPGLGPRDPHSLHIL